MSLEKVQKIWELRFAGKISEAFALLQNFEPESPAERAEAFLLNCSFSRHASKLDDAFAWIEKAKAELRAAGISSTFQLSLQTGICLDLQSKFAESLSHYQDAVKLARTDFERMISKANLAICRYNLGLPFGELLKEFGDLNDLPIVSSIKQLRLIELKQYLQNGDLEGATQLNFPELCQGLYLQAWAESLPWYSGKRSKLPLFRELASSETEYFQKNYLLQTLQADPRFSAADDTQVPVQERADRIYLWTWRWLENPVSVSAKLLGEELSRFPFDTAHLTMTDEDFLLLRTAGSWLSLFNSAFSSRFNSWREKYFPPLPHYALFERDLLVIDAVKSGNIAALTEILVSEPRLLALSLKVLESLHGNESKPVATQGTLIVRLSDFTLSSDAEKIVSEPMAKLLSRIVTENSLSFEECAAACFGLRTYDPLDHGPKIHNLLQRMKKVLPEGSSLTTKGQRIYLEGANNKIVLLEGSTHERSFPQVEWPDLDKKQTVGLEKKQSVDYKAKVLLAFEGKQTLSRLEIQKALELSKATTSRILLGWCKEGFLETIGAGAARSYRLPRK